MKKTIVSICIVTLFNLFALNAQVVGSVVFIMGQVYLTRDGERSSKLDIGTRIENLDYLETSADSSITLDLNALPGNVTATLEVAPSSSVYIRTDKLPVSQSNDIELLTGSIQMKVKRLTGSSAGVQVRTPSMILGVRGTEFAVSSFNGTTIIGCETGEVFCAPSSDFASKTPSQAAMRKGSVSKPGTVVLINDSGTVATAEIDKEKFATEWKAFEKKWRSFEESLVVADSVTFLNRFLSQWSSSSSSVISNAQSLRNNETLIKWLKEAASRQIPSNKNEWVEQRQSVLRNLITMRPNLVLAMVSWYRIKELLKAIPENQMSRRLSNGMTVQAFIEAFNRSSDDFQRAVAIFVAAEKQFMLRNDGMTPFSDF